MAFILTFLGKGGTGRTTVALAAAKKFANQGKRVLLVSQDVGPTLQQALQLESLGLEPQTVGANLSVVRVQATTLLSQSWSEVKELEAQ